MILERRIIWAWETAQYVRDGFVVVPHWLPFFRRAERLHDFSNPEPIPQEVRR